MIRIITFETHWSELHGFKLLVDCEPDDYTDCLQIGRLTALYDASNNAIASIYDYAKKLDDNDYGSNAIVVILTDGMDNASNEATALTVKETLTRGIQEEILESMLSILVGVGTKERPDIQDYLDRFKDTAGITQYISLEDTEADTFSRLAKFISKSISAQSQHLGTGGPSQVLTF